MKLRMRLVIEMMLKEEELGELTNETAHALSN